MTKNSVGLALYLRSRTSYYCDFWLKFTSKCQKKFGDVPHLLHTCVIFLTICSCLFLQFILIFYATKFGNGNGNNQVFSQNLSLSYRKCGVKDMLLGIILKKYWLFSENSLSVLVHKFTIT